MIAVVCTDDRRAAYRAQMRSCAACGMGTDSVTFPNRNARACVSCAPPGRRWCGGCSLVLDLSSFYRRGTRCISCTKAKVREWHQANLPRHREAMREWRNANPERMSAYRGAHYRKNADKINERARDLGRRAARLAGAARKRARESGVPYDASSAFTRWIQDRIDGGVCDLTGLPFSRGDGRLGPRNPFVPSIDRVDPARGYVLGNVRVVCWGVNALLGEWGIEHALTIAAAFLARHGEP